MKDLSMEKLSGQYYDVLKELGNIGAGNATTALAQMLHQPALKMAGYSGHNRMIYRIRLSSVVRYHCLT